MRRAPDGCLVPTDPLAELVGGFISDWTMDRPPIGGRYGSQDAVAPIPAAAWLSENSGVAEATISRIVGRRSRMTELRIADALVAALGHPELFYDGDPPTLPVYPNPAAPASERSSCCGGVSSAASTSSTGSLSSLNGSAGFTS